MDDIKEPIDGRKENVRRLNKKLRDEIDIAIETAKSANDIETAIKISQELAAKTEKIPYTPPTVVEIGKIVNSFNNEVATKIGKAMTGTKLGSVARQIKELLDKYEHYLENYIIYSEYIDQYFENHKEIENYNIPIILEILKGYVDKYKIKENKKILSQAEKNRIDKYIIERLKSNITEDKELISLDPNFYLMLQGKGTNTLSKIKTSSLLPAQIGLLGDAVIRVDDTFTLTIKDYTTLKNGIPATALQLLDSLLIHFTETGTKDIHVKLPLKKYMEMRGLKDEKTARKQVLADIEALKKIQYEAREKISGKWTQSGNIYLFGGSGYIKNSIIHFNFNADFYSQLLNYKVMEYSKETLKINPKLNPHAYYFSRFIDENHRLNEGKNREGIITIKSLIAKAIELPTYEEVAASNRDYKGRIIEPVLRDLDSLDRVFYDLIDINGQIIINPQDLSYNDFINCKIKIDYADYVKHPEREANKRKHTQKALAAKKKSNN